MTADERLAKVRRALDLERRDESVFSAPSGRGRYRQFGGLVAAQAAVAAQRTVAEERKLHSLHVYFLRAGDPAAETRFDVTALTDGGSFSGRQVMASQKGRVILQAAASFAPDEESFEWQAVETPKVPSPEGLPVREIERARRYRDKFGVDSRIFRSPVEVRLCDPEVVAAGESRSPEQSNWLRVVGELSADPHLQRAFLVYASDRMILSTARLPYDVGRQNLLSVSLDHSVWIHRDFDLTQWHLQECSCPVSRSSRALVQSQIYSQDGACVATVVQQGLVRLRRGG